MEGLGDTDVSDSDFFTIIAFYRCCDIRRLSSWFLTL